MLDQVNYKKIEDRTFYFAIIPPVEAVRVQTAILKVIGEPLFKTFMGLKSLEKKKASEAELKTEALAAAGAAIGLLTSGLQEEELLTLLTRVFKYVSLEAPNTKTRGLRIDEDFMGKNYQLWEVFIAALIYNFKDFFPERLLASFREQAARLEA